MLKVVLYNGAIMVLNTTLIQILKDPLKRLTTKVSDKWLLPCIMGTIRSIQGDKYVRHFPTDLPKKI